jgi:hypothetical protein
MLDVYPSVAFFIKNHCDSCNKTCQVPSLEMFCCVLNKLNKKEKGSEKYERKEKCEI